ALCGFFELVDAVVDPVWGGELGDLLLVESDGFDEADEFDVGDDDGVGCEVHGEDHGVEEFVFVVVGVVGLGGGEVFLWVGLCFSLLFFHLVEGVDVGFFELG
ncbi:hypothetical protein, partial [Marinomonas transparens]